MQLSLEIEDNGLNSVELFMGLQMVSENIIGSESSYASGIDRLFLISNKIHDFTLKLEKLTPTVLSAGAA